MPRRPSCTSFPAEPFPLPMAAEDWSRVVEQLRLSPRQSHIAALVMLGKRDKEILAILGGRRSSLRTQFARAFARAGVDSRQNLALKIVAVAQQLGIRFHFPDDRK